MPDAPSIILLHGTDEYAINGHIERLCSGLGDPASAGMNIARFDARLGLDYEAFNVAVNAAPFLASRRVVVVFHPSASFAPLPNRKKNPGQGDSAMAGGALPEVEEPGGDSRQFSRRKFLALLEKAQPTTNIALVEYRALKNEHWLLNWVRQSAGRAGSHVYNLPAHQEMPRWIEAQAKKLGGKMEPAAAVRLSDLVGEDTQIATQELIKLITYVNAARPITLQDVDQVGIASAQGNIFELVDALGQGEGKKAQAMLHRLLEEQDAFPLWGMVIRQFRLLLQVREMLDAGESLPRIQAELRLHVFVASKVAVQAKRFSLPALESIYHKLLEIDEGAKTSQVPLDLALDLLVVELARK